MLFYEQDQVKIRMRKNFLLFVTQVYDGGRWQILRD